MFNKKNKFNQFFLVFLLSLSLGLVFFTSPSFVLAGDSFGTEFIEGEINLSNKDPRAMASQIINIALSVLAVIAVIIVIYGGFIWMTSEGNEEKVDKAKKILKAGVIGLAIILASWGIASFALNKIGGATGTIDVSCEDGQVRACGCEGVSTCVDGKWGSCIGSNCEVGDHGSSCTAGLLGTCLPDNTLCNTGLICNDSCQCIYPGEGDPCGEIESGVCSPDDNDCSSLNLICSDDCLCIFNNDNNYSELGDPCNDEGVCDSENKFCNPNHGLVCSSETCTCVGNPIVTGFSPLGGFCNNDINIPCSQDSHCNGGTCNFTIPNTSAGNFFTILGYNFDSYDPNSSEVYFIVADDPSIPPLKAESPADVNSYCDNSWTNTSIIVALPQITPFVSGDDLDIEIITKENKSYKISENSQLDLVKWNNISRPGVCSISEEKAKINEEIWYYGTNLKDGQAYFGNTVDNILAYAPQIFNNETSGAASVPNLSDGKTSTFVQKIVSSVPVFSNFLGFTKLIEDPQGPSISSFSPSSGPSGQYVTITGSNFGNFRGSSSVIFRKYNDNSYFKEANYNFPQVCAQSIWSDKQIIIKVPDNIDNSDYEVVLKIGNWPELIANNLFVVDSSLSLTPGLCKISPNSGPQKSPLSLWGEYFGTNPSVIFNINKTSSNITLSEDSGADKISTTVAVDAITGPVIVKRDSLNSNSLNFFVSSCGSDDDCNSGFCCSPGTPLAGSCVNNENDCFSGNPISSIFQWGFTTGFSTSTTPTGDDIYSCASYNFCPTNNWTCPNMPGLCSPYNAEGKVIEFSDCQYNCSDFDFCGSSGTSCSYEKNIDKCVIDNYDCSLSKEVEYNIGYGTTTKTAVCKNYKTQNSDKQYFEITVDNLCPTINGTQWDLVPGTNNKCVDADFGVASSTCFLCPTGATCQSKSSGDETGFCASPKVCPGNATCNTNNKCEKPDTSSCQCCCEKSKNLVPGPGNPACCYPLICTYSCGVSAVVGATNTDFGLCSGCKISDTASTADRDLACNCATVSGQYCEVSSQYLEGACLDCTSLGESACKEHSSTCCWDEKKDTCRGGVGDETVWGTGNTNEGYCPYYECDISNPTLCSSLPVVDGDYSSINACDEGCGLNCAQIDNETVCKDEAACCWNDSNEECLGGEKYSETNGLCAYFNCVTPGLACVKGTTTTKYLEQDTCDENCFKTSSGFNGPCSIYPNDFCSFDLCNLLSCLDDNGNIGNADNVPDSCGICCCDPLSNEDDCSNINEKLTCVADKGLCEGPSRGLCCGCSSDSDCSPDGIDPEQVGCGYDSCCKARPKIEENDSKIASLDVSPEHTQNNVCRNALIEINFDQRIDVLSLNNNILLVEENYTGSCSQGTYQVSFDSDFYNKDNSVFAKVKNIFQKLSIFISRLAGKTVMASPNSSNTYCAILGLSDFIHDNGKTKVYFKPNNLLKPETKYFVIVKGDEDLDSSTGILSSTGVGMNGPGYYNFSGNWIESDINTNIKFGSNEVYFKNSYIWEFTTLDVNTSGQGICEVDYVDVFPESYLFQTTVNDINENDVDENHSTFNSVRDRDVQYTARAYSIDNQLITPTPAYNWTWNWGIGNNNILNFDNGVIGWNVNGDKRLVKVNDGITEGKSSITATIEMSSGNMISGGDGISGQALAYILICRNPWPSFKTNGLWEPWRDTSAFGQFNYELYYCRDHGSDNENDDLPAFLNDLAITKGDSLIRVCSNLPSQTCSANSDCPAGGLCLASFLKETYFFRDTIERFVKNVLVVDNETGGELSLFWQSEKDLVTSYKVYYKLSGDSSWSSKTIDLNNCNEQNNLYYCNYVLDNLINGQEYSVYIVAMNNNIETNPSLTYMATPTLYSPDLDFSCGELLNYQGYSYKTAEIDGRCWMVENLRATKYNDNTNIITGLDDANWASTIFGAYDIFDPTKILDISTENEMLEYYGILYNWYAASHENICPEGWSIPTLNDFLILTSIFGGDSSSSEAMRSTRTSPDTHPRWRSPNPGATNESGFTALPAGYKNYLSNFYSLETFAYFWTKDGSSDGFDGSSDSSAMLLSITFDESKLDFIDINKNSGLSIRCFMEE